MLIAGVVQNDFDRRITVLLFELPKKVDQRIGCNVGGVGKGYYFFCDGMHRPQHIDPVTAAASPNEQPGHTPQTAHKRTENKMRGIHKKTSAFYLLVPL